jgi:hypothetical protein
MQTGILLTRNWGSDGQGAILASRETIYGSSNLKVLHLENSVLTHLHGTSVDGCSEIREG